MFINLDITAKQKKITNINFSLNILKLRCCNKNILYKPMHAVAKS